MNILITGGNGFIGLSLIKHLLKKNPPYNLICLVRKDISSELPKSKKLKLLSHDLNSNKIPESIKDIDTIIHLAGVSKTFLSGEEALDQCKINLRLTSNVIRIAQAFNVKKIIFASSVYVYSGKRSTAFKEDMAVFPSEFLGISKLSSEMMLRAHALASGSEVFALRLFTVFGKGSGEHQFIPQSIQKLTDQTEVANFGNPATKRDFINIDDVVIAFEKAINASLKDKFLAINIASGVGRSIKDVVHEVKRITGSTKKICFRKQISNDANIDSDHCGDIYLAKKHLKWRPKIDFQNGLQTLIKSQYLKELK